MRARFPALSLSICAPLAACTQAPRRPTALPSVVTARFVCSDDQRFEAVFDNATDHALLTFGDGTMADLIGQRPASGIWYAGASYDLRGKGTEAVLTRSNGQSATCTSMPSRR